MDNRKLPAWLFSANIDHAKIVGDTIDGDPFTFEYLPMDGAPAVTFNPNGPIPMPSNPNPAAAYATYCEQRRDAAAGPHDREFWHRQRGAALKAATL